MKWIKKILNIFRKKSNTAMLNQGIEQEDTKCKFKDAIKVNLKQINKKNKVETHVCSGDGLGIKSKIEY